VADVEKVTAAKRRRATASEARCTAVCIGRSLLLCRVATEFEVKTPVQTVHADFPHTAYR
jgi:hypothetical protein